jgi:hypothetical protein
VKRTISALLFVWSGTTPAMAEQTDVQLASLRTPTIHRFVSVTSPQGNYIKFNGLTYKS